MKKNFNIRRKQAGFVSAATLVALLSFGNIQAADDAATIKRVQDGIAKLIPGETPDSITESVIPDLYEVMIGPRLFYVSGDGKYLFNGKLFEIATREDLSTPKISLAKADAITKVGEENMIIFGSDDAKHTITVFTDIDCGYCRKLHSEITQYNDLGIRVRYMMFPRAGVGSASYTKAVSVWCADDQKAAMTLSKAGKPIDEKLCDNPIVDHMKLGELLGVTGTPAVFLSDGELMPGYVPAAKMSAYLNGRTKK
ncbi:DsbC family protein [endosymbiont of Lamellibrachia barhami]|uniref:DsbC family protein n=1 Tax=endosymbiont of Lamellibrachia barhami TaxID=205975 RepID=UPI0015A77AA3|nr:DsbC family protein [endosymbiont of Lamellibrachia barhami]